MISKHNRRAAKAAFAIALGVAIILGEPPRRRPRTARRSNADHHRDEGLPRAVHPRPALQAGARGKGVQGSYKQNVGSTELIHTALKSGKIKFYPEYTGIMLAVTFKRKTLPKTALGTYNLAKSLYGKRGQTLLRQTPFHDKTRSPSCGPRPRSTG